MTYWRGVNVDGRTAAMMDEVVRLAPSCPIWPSQGSYSGGVGASAGTHDGGGAIDIGANDMSPNQRTEVETQMRRVGFAAWVRSPSEGDWPWHIHGIAVGCADLSGPARDQVHDYNAGRNGLANNGPDTGTRAYVGTTWESYNQEDDMTPAQEESLAECRRMLAVLLGVFAPAGGEQSIGQQVYIQELRENGSETRRQGAVLLGVIAPSGAEKSIPEQVS